jgi:hypothetical protein
MSVQLTPLQTLILWALLARGGSSPQKDLKPKPEPKDRDALVRAGLVKSEKINRGIFLTVEDKGWAWAADNMTADLSVRSTAGGFVLKDLLARLAAFIRTQDLRLAEIFSVKATPDAGIKVPHKPNGEELTATDLRDRIRTAFQKISGGRFNTSIPLRDLRAELPDVDRTTLDKALLKITREEEGATLMQIDNGIEITEADREAAIQVGNEARHLLWISK